MLQRMFGANMYGEPGLAEVHRVRTGLILLGTPIDGMLCAYLSAKAPSMRAWRRSPSLGDRHYFIDDAHHLAEPSDRLTLTQSQSTRLRNSRSSSSSAAGPVWKTAPRSSA